MNIANNESLNIPQPETAQIIEIFEKFLESKGIILANFEKVDAIYKFADSRDIPNIYGSDYKLLEMEIAKILNHTKELPKPKINDIPEAISFEEMEYD